MLGDLSLVMKYLFAAVNGDIRKCSKTQTASLVCNSMSVYSYLIIKRLVCSEAMVQKVYVLRFNRLTLCLAKVFSYTRSSVSDELYFFAAGANFGYCEVLTIDEAAKV